MQVMLSYFVSPNLLILSSPNLDENIGILIDAFMLSENYLHVNLILGK